VCARAHACACMCVLPVCLNIHINVLCYYVGGRL